MANKDTLRLIALALDLPDLLNFCSSNKYTYENVSDETFWKMKLDRDFPGLWENLTHKEHTKKELYLFLRRILTKKIFNDIRAKPEIAGEVVGQDFDPFLDLYDLLYNTGNDHEYGWINYQPEWRLRYAANPIKNWEGDKIPPALRDFRDLEAMLHEELDSYREAEIGRRQKFLNDLKTYLNEKQERYERSEDTMDEIDDMMHKVDEFYEAEISGTVSLDEFLERLKTVEERLQEYIIQNARQDVRMEIREKQKQNEEAISEEGIYTNDELEFLQILHDAIRIGKLSIFDPVNYNYIMKKLTAK